MDQGPIAVTPARDQRGFTLIEMMIVVAVIAILAIIVVPAFFKESRKTKSSTEVAPMFAEFSIKEEQAKINGGLYLASAACPATPSSQGSPASTCVAGADWTALRINPPEQSLYCSYAVTIGTGTGDLGPTGFTWASPDADWYYIVATCDMDGDSAKDSQYFQSSSDTKRQVLNEGY